VSIILHYDALACYLLQQRKTACMRLTAALLMHGKSCTHRSLSLQSTAEAAAVVT
jgi:hypothetical protein